jgi:hypothetical protein
MRRRGQPSFAMHLGTAAQQICGLCAFYFLFTRYVLCMSPPFVGELRRKNKREMVTIYYLREKVQNSRGGNRARSREEDKKKVHDVQMTQRLDRQTGGYGTKRLAKIDYLGRYRTRTWPCLVAADGVGGRPIIKGQSSKQRFKGLETRFKICEAAHVSYCDRRENPSLTRILVL